MPKLLALELPVPNPVLSKDAVKVEVPALPSLNRAWITSGIGESLFEAAVSEPVVKANGATVLTVLPVAEKAPPKLRL